MAVQWCNTIYAANFKVVQWSIKIYNWQKLIEEPCKEWTENSQIYTFAWCITAIAKQFPVKGMNLVVKSTFNITEMQSQMFEPDSSEESSQLYLGSTTRFNQQLYKLCTQY